MPDLDYVFFGPNERSTASPAAPPTHAVRCSSSRRPAWTPCARGACSSGSCARWVRPGIGALLVDPRGSGESALAFEETSLETHVADIRDGLHELARRFPEAHQRVIAVRYGAVPALIAAEPPATDALLLIDPCLDTRAALRQDLRGEIAKRMRRGGPAGEGDDRDALVAQIDAGTPIVLDGERFPPALWRGLNASQPAAAAGDVGRPRDRPAQRSRDVRAVPPPAAAGARDRRGAGLRGRRPGLGARMRRRAFVVRAGDGAAIVCTAHEPAGARARPS